MYIYVCIYVHAVKLENRTQRKSITNLGYRIAIFLALGSNPFSRRDNKCALKRRRSSKR